MLDEECHSNNSVLYEGCLIDNSSGHDADFGDTYHIDQLAKGHDAH